jgi:1-acyl-sn-glycerol-3-phosphate acyltransferase
MLFYRVMRWLSWVLLKVFFRFRVTGSGLIPTEGPLVVVANHEGFLDPFAVGVALRKRPPATFLAAPWIYDKPIAGGFARRVGTVPAYGEGKEVTALRESIRVLQRGGTVALFPQGGIARDGVSGGALFMALKGQAPLLPMRVTGAAKALPRGRWWPSLFTRIEVAVQPLINPADLRAKGASTSEAVDRGAELLARELGLSLTNTDVAPH